MSIIANMRADITGDIKTILWTKAGGPSGTVIFSPDNGSAAVTASNLKRGTYTFRCKVTATNGQSATDTIVVDVK